MFCLFKILNETIFFDPLHYKKALHLAVQKKPPEKSEGLPT
jgi:hypothetical protein